MGKKVSVVCLLGAMLLVLTGLAAPVQAEVNVNVGIFAPPPAYVFDAPPPVVVIPGTYVYTVPDVDFVVFFHHGYWWRPYEGRWYRAKGHNGPWTHMHNTKVPHAVRTLPHDHHRYRHLHDHGRISHKDYSKHWKKWERDKRWERDERWSKGRHEFRHDDRNRGRDHDGRRGDGRRDDDHRGGRDDRHRDDDDRGRGRGGR